MAVPDVASLHPGYEPRRLSSSGTRVSSLNVAMNFSSRPRNWPRSAGVNAESTRAWARCDGTADQPGLLELLDHHAGGRAVEPEQARDRDLVDAGPVPEREQDAVLPVGDAERAGLRQEQRHRDLVRAADHEAGAAIEVFEL